MSFAAGVAAIVGGEVVMTGGSIVTRNPSAAAIATQAFIPLQTVVNTVTLTDVNVTAAGVGILAADGTSVITLKGSTLTSGSLALDVGPVDATPLSRFPAEAIVTFDASRVTGAMVTAEGSTSTVTLSNGTIWNMQAGNSNVTSLTDSASTINFPDPAGPATLLESYHTLTAMTYTGNGGTINMNTFLGGSSSPSDRIVITGSASSTVPTALVFHNTGGPGAETIGNGIQAVQANPGATTDGAFRLGNPELRAGFFDYRLFKGGIDGDAESWFLRSDFIPVPGPPGTPVFLGPTPATPIPPLGPALPGEEFPIIGPELATYGVVQPIARELGLATLGTLHERFGDSVEGTCAVATASTCCSTPSGATITKTESATTASCHPGAWGRVIAQSVDNRYQAFADPQATGQIVGFQAGFDLWRGSLIPGQTDTAGIYFAYANAGIDVNGLVTNQAATAYQMTHTGTVGLNSYSGGAYWTHYGATGWYIDAVIQGTGYDGSATTQFANLPLNGSGLVTSLEAGYPFPFPWFGPRFVLEPQAQIIWQEVSFQGANDGLGPVDLGSTSGATGRLGVRGRWTVVSATGTVWQPYVQANVWRDWGAEADTIFGTSPVPLLEQATRLEFAGGVTARLNAKWSVFAQGGYQYATDESGANPFRRDSVKGDFGFRYTW